MSKEKIYRAGLIPYRIVDGEIVMLFMKPSKKEYGGAEFQIAKGKREEGETDKDTAIREAKEELGFFIGNVDGNVVHVGNFLGRTEVFVAKIKDKTMFGEPHYETSETTWLTLKEYKKVGRKLHIPVVKAVVRKIKKLEK